MDINVISMAAGVCAVAVLLYVFMSLRALTKLNKEVNDRWKEIDDLLEQRQENLIKILKVAGQFLNVEPATLKKITEARALYENAKTVDQRVQADQVLSASVTRFFILADQNPKLKSQTVYTQLEQKINRLEGIILEVREEYNQAVTHLNTAIAKGKNKFFAKVLGYSPRSEYRTGNDDRTDVSISFKSA